MKVKDQNPTGLRIPPELKDWFKAQAKLNNRSLNAEIVFRLQQFKSSHEQTA